ncbi:MAG TPA: STAS domain-containing protein [Bryobacteraceae bacterium]|nr:STAS domain-containing protein [Bryobacteraceae bacterium]
MSIDLHRDAVYREELLARYLRRQLGETLAGEIERHYLACEECFVEIEATRMLMEALKLPPIASSHVGDVAVLRFPQPTELLRSSLELKAMVDAVHIQNESRVLIDMSTVSRIDSTGLGVLVNCYCHALRNSGAVKLLQPTASVKQVLKITSLDSVLETFDDEGAAIQSFGQIA